MKKVIIGIHGLGNKPSKRLLKEWWKQSMMEGLAALNKFHPLPEFELVYWADVLYDKPLDANIADPDDPFFLEEIYTPAIRNFHSKTETIRLKISEFVIKQLKSLFLNKDFSLKNKIIAENIVQRYFHELDVYYNEPEVKVNPVLEKARQIMIERVVSVLRKYEKYEIL